MTVVGEPKYLMLQFDILQIFMNLSYNNQINQHRYTAESNQVIPEPHKNC